MVILPECNGLVMSVYSFYDSEAGLSVLVSCKIKDKDLLIPCLDSENERAHCPAVE
jgi:hypothetical protein